MSTANWANLANWNRTSIVSKAQCCIITSLLGHWSAIVWPLLGSIWFWLIWVDIHNASHESAAGSNRGSGTSEWSQCLQSCGRLWK
jgi:hypothetical protein